ncbi:MAG: phenylacetic acid degradation operon negative regulatory protein PaaX [Pseudorhodoplanes sp.]|nr:phenylacetic acid degradation operon negative regulatory protein PaaX [Pseudorhodoplanes sp.]
MTSAPVRKLLDDFHARRPVRAWSLIVTLYGDAIVPRGGSLWLGSLTEIMALFRIDAGHVRTAMSRLTADGWLERIRTGRNSYYRLSRRGEKSFVEATQRIYFAHAPTFDGQLTLALLGPDAEGRPALRAALDEAGFAALSPTSYVATGNLVGAVPALEGVFLLTADARNAQALATAAWKLAPLAQAYENFVARFSRFESSLKTGATAPDADALIARTLLIHEFRRAVLRDPGLPTALLPADWPGAQARQLAARVYRHLVGPAERYLSDHAANEKGPLPPPEPAFLRRFAGG